MAKPVVFEDIFEVLATDPGGKHFDKGGPAGITCYGLSAMTFTDSDEADGCLLTLNVRCFCFAVTRFHCHSDLYEMDLMLDVNTSIYPLQVASCVSPSLDNAWSAYLCYRPSRYNLKQFAVVAKPEISAFGAEFILQR